MKLIKSIVGLDDRIAAFVVEAKGSEFGADWDNTKKQYVLKVDEILSINPKSPQFYVANGKLYTKGDFKFNSLPLAVINVDGQVVDVENKMTLTCRILVDGKIKGFRVDTPTGTGKPYKYKQVLTLMNWYKPTNFTSREVDGKKCIVGLRGHKIGDLPEEEYVGNPSTNSSKKARVSSKAVPKEEVEGKSMELNGDILSLLEDVDSCGGVVIQFNDSKYHAISDNKTKAGDGIMYSNLGEVGRARLDFSETNINANINFKKPGTVVVDGFNQPVQSFTWSKKTLFSKGINNMPVIGIGVTPDVAEKIKATYGNALIAKRITDENRLKEYKWLTLRNDLEYFETRADKLELMTKERANGILANAGNYHNTIVALTSKMFGFKKQISLAKKFKEELQAEVGEAVIHKIAIKNNKLFAQYQDLSVEQIKAINSAGINVCTGAYDVRVDKTPKETADKKSGSDETKDKTYKFEMKNHKTIPIGEAKALIESNKAPASIVEAYAELCQIKENCKDVESRYNAIMDYINIREKEQTKIKDMLWNIKVAILVANGGVFAADNQWQEIANRSTKGERTFENVSDPSIRLRLNGIEIVNFLEKKSK